MPGCEQTAGQMAHLQAGQRRTLDSKSKPSGRRVGVPGNESIQRWWEHFQAGQRRTLDSKSKPASPRHTPPVKDVVGKMSRNLPLRNRERRGK